MAINENLIALNFLKLSPQNFDIKFFYKRIEEIPAEEHKKYYQLNFKENESSEKYEKYAITFEPTDTFIEKNVKSDYILDLTKKYILFALQRFIKDKGIQTLNVEKGKYQRIYFELKRSIEGIEAIWIEPYYLRNGKCFGFLIDFKFWVDAEYSKTLTGSVDKRILQLSGTLNNKGLSNSAFYQFKYEKTQSFLAKFYPGIKIFAFNDTEFGISETLYDLRAYTLNPKRYQFYDNKESNSAYLGLKQNSPYKKPEKETEFLFIFKENDRNYAINLLNGLKGSTYPANFEGIEKMFRIAFNNDCIKGKKVNDYTPEVLSEIVTEVNTEREKGKNVLPIFLTNSKNGDANNKIYYTIKHTFTKQNIACQIVTKDLVLNTGALKYSLSNIGLQIFAKIGGQPWKVKPAIKECLIIGIGSKNKEIYVTDDAGNKTKVIEKFLTYSVLTDSSGLFKEIQILSETDNEEDYYTMLISKLKSIIQKAVDEGNKDIVIHSPFRISKSKVWDILFTDIPTEINISILLINDQHKYFGYDFSKNSLIPYESSFVALSELEYLVWFEGLQYQNTTITKLIGGPIYINFWHANNKELLTNVSYRMNLLQDCINLSGANWVGFKAKQLPVSIFYCQKIADFLKKFEDYNLEHIEFENLKPWFL